MAAVIRKLNQISESNKDNILDLAKKNYENLA